MSDPTIRLSSCRPDGICPACGLRASDQFGYRLPCGCYWHLSCGEEQSRTRAQHLSDLLTEALRRNSNEYMRGVEAVLRIRCMKHRFVPELNSVVHGGGECAVCAVENLRGERDAAIRRADEACATLAEEREAMASISAELVQAQVEAGGRADRAEALLRVVLDSAPISTVSPLLAKIREVLQ